MKQIKKGIKLILLILMFFCFSDIAGAVFIKVNGLQKKAINKVSVSYLDNNKIYAVSSNTFFKSDDGGVSWNNVFVSKAEEIKDIYVDKYIYDTVYIVTESSLYRFSGAKKEKIFSFPSEVEGICISKYGGIVYAGTTDGVYHASEDFWKWTKLKGLLPGTPVYSIRCLPYAVFIASDLGVYASDKRGGFVRKFVLKKVDSESDDEENGEGEIVCRRITHDIFDPNRLYLGTSKGLFASFDKGETWQRVVIPSIYNADIRDITQSYAERKNIYLATDKGVFSVNIDDRSSRSLFEGLDTKDILGIDFNRKGVLFAATSKGLFSKEEVVLAESFVEIDKLTRNEPSIREIQDAALRYNEVHPDKIRKWRNALKYRALFPSVSLDYDKTIYGTAGTSTYDGKSYVGPRDWGLSLSWDVGNLVWNSYEDDVDTRSRLVTQLRINILDDINATYFERLRTKEGLMNKSYNNSVERMKDELRLKELTASLDGYTGGYFSKRLKELREKTKR